MADDEVASDESRLIASYGSVTGRVLTLPGRHRLWFSLYDGVYKRMVTCFVDAQRVEEVRQAWRRRVRVHGLVSRSISSGRPESVHDVGIIDIIESKTVAMGRWFEGARGTAPLLRGAPDAVEAIRQVRDIW